MFSPHQLTTGRRGRAPTSCSIQEVSSRHRCSGKSWGLPLSAANMGLEKEKADARIFMDEDEFNRSSAPMLMEKTYESQPDRDPHNLNGHLKLSFEDVIAEPDTTHSFDKVWICSTALFEISKYLIYKVLTVFLAIPLAFVIGLLFAVLSCLHIWVVMPFVRTCLMMIPPVQAVWKGITESFVAPLYASMGRCLSSVSVRVDQPF